MATEVLLPKIGFVMTEGQPLFNLESDKSVTEIEAPAAGTLHIIKQPGEIYQVGTILAEIKCKMQ